MNNITIEQAKRAFKRWRKVRQGNSAVPAHLRRMAVEIKSKHGYSIAHKELHLSSHSLWKWERYCDEQGRLYRSRQSAKHKKTYRTLNTLASPKPLQFIELTKLPDEQAKQQIAQEGPGHRVSQKIEWLRPDGCRLRVKADLGLAQIGELAKVFITFGSRPL